jgi:aminoglycoside phosphotransferase (APT) family kinase protein
MTNSPPWATDFSLTPEKVHDIIVANIKDFSIESIELLGEGWDNTLWRVNQIWCFRFPKHAQSAQLLLDELKVLILLPDLGVARPTPYFIIETPLHFPYPFYAYSFLSGKTADKCALTNEQRLKLVMPLAHFFKTLHAFSIEKALARGFIMIVSIG